MLLLAIASFAICTGCKKEDSFIPPSAQSSSVSDELNSDKRTEVFTTTTTLTSSGIPPKLVVKTGAFEASPELITLGTYVMYIKTFTNQSCTVEEVGDHYSFKNIQFKMTRCTTNINGYIITHYLRGYHCK